MLSDVEYTKAYGLPADLHREKNIVRQRNLVLSECIDQIEGLHRFIDSLTTIGFIIHVREALYSGCEEVMKRFVPSFVEALQCLTANIEGIHQGATRDILPLFDLGSGARATNKQGLDLALVGIIQKNCFAAEHLNGTAHSSSARVDTATPDNNDGISIKSTKSIDNHNASSNKSDGGIFAAGAVEDEGYEDDIYADMIQDFEKAKLNSQSRQADPQGLSGTPGVENDMKELSRTQCFEVLPAALASIFVSDLWESKEAKPCIYSCVTLCC